MADAVTEVISAPDQPDPIIVRKLVEVPERDIDGKPTGGTVLQERITGNVKYSTHLLPDGQEILAPVYADGVLMGTFRWTAESLPGKNAIAQFRLVVGDNCEQDTLTKPEPKEL